MLNDIALMILSEPIKSNEYMKPACLPKSLSLTYPGCNLDAAASGWVNKPLNNLFPYIKVFYIFIQF